MPPQQPPSAELCADLCALLAPELVLQVLTFGAHADRHLAVTLLRVSRWTQALVQPLLFRALHLRRDTRLPILHHINSYLQPTFFIENPVHTLVLDAGITLGPTLEAACAQAHTLVVHASLLPRVRTQLTNARESSSSLDVFAPYTVVVLGTRDHRDHVRWSARCFAHVERLVCTAQFPSFEREPPPPSLAHLVVPMHRQTSIYIDELRKTREDVCVTVYEHKTLRQPRIFPAMPNVKRVKWRLKVTAFDPWHRDPPLDGLFE